MPLILELRRQGRWITLSSKPARATQRELQGWGGRKGERERGRERESRGGERFNTGATTKPKFI